MATVHDPAVALRAHFQIRPDLHFLNHGSFGATPRVVQRAASRWRTRMERQPVAFLGRELSTHLRGAREALAGYLGAQPADLAFVTNATVGVNVVARSLQDLLQPGDEVLGTDHEYGACANAWEFVCAQRGARYVRQPLPMPDELPSDVDAQNALAQAYLAGVTERTKVLFLSHITSPTAVRLPVEQIVRFARERGIFTLIDGAHAPGQIPLSLDDLGADFYTGNCHKWLCAPKGAAFLHVRADRQRLIKPLVVSWGWAPERQFFAESDFQDALQWGGTTDHSAALAIPAAIRFQQHHDWTAVRRHCADVLDRWLPRLSQAAATQTVYPSHAASLRPPQMAVVALHASVDARQVQKRLHDEFRIEMPGMIWRGRNFVRVSCQGYNTESDFAALESALKSIF